MNRTLDNCNMEKIYGDLFQALTVKILEIKDTPIKDISENTFQGAISDGMKVRHDLFSLNNTIGCRNSKTDNQNQIFLQLFDFLKNQLMAGLK